MTGLIAARHLGSEGKAYDLGCSLGASTLAVLKQNESPGIEIIGVDSSEPMIEQADPSSRIHARRSNARTFAMSTSTAQRSCSSTSSCSSFRPRIARLG